MRGASAPVQDFLGRQILVENLSSYFAYAVSRLTEWEFLAAWSSGAGCGLLLDVNNLYVNSVNLGLDARDYIDSVPRAAAVRSISRATRRAARPLIDTHGATVCAEVWSLYEDALARFGPVPTLIEWDTDIPGFAVLHAEAARAQARLAACHALAA